MWIAKLVVLYSLVGIVDLFVLICLWSAFLGISRSFLTDVFRLYFAAKLVFYENMTAKALREIPNGRNVN